MDSQCGEDSEREATESRVVRVALVPGDEISWRMVRADLAALDNVSVVGEAGGVAAAIALAQREKPDIVVCGAYSGGVLVSGMIHAIVEQAPDTRFALISDVFPPAVLEVLARARPDTCLTWHDLNDKALKVILEVLVDTDLWLLTPQLAAYCLSVPRPRPTLTVTEQEVDVIQYLEAGLEPSEIADKEYLSLRTIERRIHGLEDKLGVTTLYTLAVGVRRQGLHLHQRPKSHR